MSYAKYWSGPMMYFYGMSAAGAAAYLMYKGESPSLSRAFLQPIGGGVVFSFVTIWGLKQTKLLAPNYMMAEVDSSLNPAGIVASAGLGAAGAMLTQRFF